jgi:hypothetical protein
LISFFFYHLRQSSPLIEEMGYAALIAYAVTGCVVVEENPNDVKVDHLSHEASSDRVVDDDLHLSPVQGEAVSHREGTDDNDVRRGGENCLVLGGGMATRNDCDEEIHRVGVQRDGHLWRAAEEATANLMSTSFVVKHLSL